MENTKKADNRTQENEKVQETALVRAYNALPEYTALSADYLAQSRVLDGCKNIAEVQTAMEMLKQITGANEYRAVAQYSLIAKALQKAYGFSNAQSKAEKSEVAKLFGLSISTAYKYENLQKVYEDYGLKNIPAGKEEDGTPKYIRQTDARVFRELADFSKDDYLEVRELLLAGELFDYEEICAWHNARLKSRNPKGKKVNESTGKASASAAGAESTEKGKAENSKPEPKEYVGAVDMKGIIEYITKHYTEIQSFNLILKDGVCLHFTRAEDQVAEPAEPAEPAEQGKQGKQGKK